MTSSGAPPPSAASRAATRAGWRPRAPPTPTSRRAVRGGAVGGRAALDAGYRTRASGVTLDRFCGSGITSVNLAAAQIMSGMEDLVIAGGTEMMSYTATQADP